MSLMEDFERSHLRTFAEYEDIPLPKRTWRTPDGQWWTPQSILEGWQRRISDHWAWLTLHCWIVQDDVDVTHVELPAPLRRHEPIDPAWTYVDQLYGPGIREADAHPLGRADLLFPGEGGEPSLMVEFGTCAPAKFTINLGSSSTYTHWMSVPYGCEYGFVFTARRALLTPRGSKMAEFGAQIAEKTARPVATTRPLSSAPHAESTSRNFTMTTFRNALRRRKDER